MTSSTGGWNTAGTSAGAETGALVAESILLGVYPGAPEVCQLVNQLRPIGLDLGKLSIVFLETAPPSGFRSGRMDPFADLRERLRARGATSFESDGGEVWVAGPVAGLVFPAGKGRPSPSGVVGTIGEALSRWGVRLEELSGLKASMASGRALVLLHVTAGEVPLALSAMKRSPAEYVTWIGHGPESFLLRGAGSEGSSGIH